MTPNNFKTFIKSKTATVTMITLFALALLFAVFSVGAAVGYHRARLAYNWSENYQKNFAGPRGGFLVDFSGGDLVENYGTFGRVIKVGQANFIIQGRDNVERVIVVNADTSVNRFHDVIQLSDLKINDSVIIIGEPNDKGQIEAKFVRVMPEPVIATPTIFIHR